MLSEVTEKVAQTLLERQGCRIDVCVLSSSIWHKQSDASALSDGGVTIARDKGRMRIER